MKVVSILGQPSWHIRSQSIEAWVTRLGGHLGPVSFKVGGRRVRPYAVAPWAGEALPAGTPPVLQALRGDFFCLPFGGPAPDAPPPERHPMHGDVANGRWRRPTLTREGDRLIFRAEIRSRFPAGTVRKEIILRDGHAAVYHRHTLFGMSGRTSYSYHPMLQFPGPAGSGLISTSPLRFGQVRPGRPEDPTRGGYSSLRPGAVFHSLRRVPADHGGSADLTRYPARLGYEDYVMVANRPVRPFAWTAVAFPEERYVWFVLKNPRVLPSTFLWFANGGLHSAPARGRLRGILGVEDIAAYFGNGGRPVPPSNAFRSRGHPTHGALDPQRPSVVATIAGVAAIPPGFGRVSRIVAGPGRITLVSGRRRVSCPLDHEFLSRPHHAADGAVKAG